MKEQLSNCCQAHANVDSIDEGISYYVCSACEQMCDLYFNRDEFHKRAVLNIMKNERVYIDKAELERLKRLDENVKKIINDTELSVITKELLKNLYK